MSAAILIVGLGALLGGAGFGVASGWSVWASAGTAMLAGNLAVMAVVLAVLMQAARGDRDGSGDGGRGGGGNGNAVGNAAANAERAIAGHAPLRALRPAG